VEAFFAKVGNSDHVVISAHRRPAAPFAHWRLPTVTARGT
jgi:hypothetical protein